MKTKYKKTETKKNLMRIKNKKKLEKVCEVKLMNFIINEKKRC